jgi:hypothetical protein
MFLTPLLGFGPLLMAYFVNGLGNDWHMVGVSKPLKFVLFYVVPTISSPFFN